MSLRLLTPWAELGSPNGQSPSKSLLLTYTADLPIACTIKAVSNTHYRVALTSLLSFIFILLPILAGGLFFPLTTTANEVRMIPSLPAFYILLTLLILYLIGLLALVPSRHQLHLPHGVKCLAEIFTFMYNSPVLSDAAFSNPRSKADLVSRLLALNAAGQEKRYAFGVYHGRNGKECMGIERVGRRDQDLLILAWIELYTHRTKEEKSVLCFYLMICDLAGDLFIFWWSMFIWDMDMDMDTDTDKMVLWAASTNDRL